MSISFLLGWQGLVGSLDEESSFADQGSFAEETCKRLFLKKNQESSRNVIVCVMHTVANTLTFEYTIAYDKMNRFLLVFSWDTIT